MITAVKKNRSPLRIIIKIVLFIWLTGTIISGLHYNYISKKQCIKEEGWLKGWLWCTKETQNTFSLNMLRGFVWPLEITSISEKSPTQRKSRKPIMTQEQFNVSSTGVSYSCWAIALRTDRDEDTEAFAQMISWLKEKDPILKEMHGDYLYYAALNLNAIQSKEGFDNYYKTMCAEPIVRMKKAISQGMMK